MAVETFKVVVGKPSIEKDPNAVLDYSIDWADWLLACEPDDTIQTHQIVLQAASALVVEQSATVNAGTRVTFWLSGGTAGTVERVVCRITTADGRIDDRSVWIKIKER
jgi:hypothetical protein